MKSQLTAEQLREVVSYDPETGAFKWRPRSRVGVHRPVGTLSHGYLVIGIGGRGGVPRAAHRLAWLYVHGEWPANEIDHINGDKLDNRIANLRDVSSTTNKENARKPKRNNKSGVLGVRKHGNRFVAGITRDYKSYYIGCFATAEQAHEAYVAAKREHHAGNTL